MKEKILTFLLTLSPIITLAAGTLGGGTDGIGTFLGSVGGWVYSLGKILFAAVVAAFFWGLLIFLFGGESKRDSGKSMMLWGIIAIFVMSSIWGIVGLLSGSLGLEKNASSIAPESVMPAY